MKKGAKRTKAAEIPDSGKNTWSDEREESPAAKREKTKHLASSFLLGT